MSDSSYPSGEHDFADDGAELEALESAMDVAPRGAAVISGVAVGLLVLCWLLIYIFVFLPRGTVG